MAAWTLRLLDGTSSTIVQLYVTDNVKQTREKEVKSIYTYIYIFLDLIFIYRKWRLTLFLFE